MKLIIVESPTKCATIKRYLGDDYEVLASRGHVRDLATSGKGGLGVDVENDFKPTYVINKERAATVKELKRFAKKAEDIILATDPDREGEAIAWHLAQILELDLNTTKRLEFHEITRDSVTHAIANPKTIDLDLVSSQETRRILDRIIGFKLSSFLYKKIRSRSAGRVQSATLKIIADVDNEIKAFVPEEYWKILVDIDIHGTVMALDLKKINDEKVEIHNDAEASQILALVPDVMKVKKVKKEIKSRVAKPPFTTSTLQQAAYNKFGYKTSKTSIIAQKLYEGVAIKDGLVGLITYMRTDSTRLSETFINRAKNYITEAFGANYIGETKKSVKKRELAQDAHEAIRPTGNHRTPQSLKPYLTTEEYNIYKLIYNRAVASIMAPKKEEITTVTFEENGLTFALQGSRRIFDGYEILYQYDDDAFVDKYLPKISEGEEFKITAKNKEQEFTQPPAHFSEARIIKTMEQVGIGRPSTYASTIAILQKRKYVTNESGVLKTTDQGQKTIAVLGEYFPEIIDAKYTAKMEEKLDNIASKKLSQFKILKSFYQPFMDDVAKAMQKAKDDEPPTGKFCPKCGSPLVYKNSKKGKFLGCSAFPKCRYIEKDSEK